MSTKPELPNIVDEDSAFQPASRMLSVDSPPIVELLAATETRWPAVPVNVSRAFWSAVEIVTETAGPPAVIVPVTSLVPAASVTVTLPVFGPAGSTTTE